MKEPSVDEGSMRKGGSVRMVLRKWRESRHFWLLLFPVFVS